MKKKKYLKKLVVTFLFTLLSLTSISPLVEAAKGNFRINNQVIYEKEGGSQSGTATFTINQLFLHDMSELDKQTAKKNQKIVTAAQNEVFTKESPKLESLDKKVTPQLFMKDYTMAEEAHSTSTSTQKQSKGLFVVLCLLGGSIVIFLGIVLGKQFPRLLKRT